MRFVVMKSELLLSNAQQLSGQKGKSPKTTESITTLLRPSGGVVWCEKYSMDL